MGRSDADRDNSENPVELSDNEFRRKAREMTDEDPSSNVHRLGRGIRCDTEARGHAEPHGDSPFKIVLEASEGFIPLWDRNSILRWRFREPSMSNFANPTAAKNEIRKLFGEALLAWGDAAPVRFTEDKDVWDFQIVMRGADDCDPTGCVLASAFFPDSGRHEFVMYPRLFTQSRAEQVETFIHEIGHIFGLRHFFAQIHEKKWPSEIFGEHKPFSIMNYGSMSSLTDADRDDLTLLYQSAWNGTLTHVNGTPIRFVKPYHTLGAGSMMAVGSFQPVCEPQPWTPYVTGAQPSAATALRGGRRSR